MAYTAKTNSALSLWWLYGTGTGSVNRLAVLITDWPDGPYYDVASSWIASAGDAAEYYHVPTNQPDNVYVSGAKLTKMADDTCIDGGGGGLADGEWCWETGNSRVYVQIAAGDPVANADFYYSYNGGYAGQNFLTETIANYIYIIHQSFEVGNGSTSTILDIIDGEVVHVVANLAPPRVRANSTLNIGVKDTTTGRGHSGGVLVVQNGTYTVRYPNNSASANFNIYGSFYHVGAYHRMVYRDGKLNVIDSILKRNYPGIATSQNYWQGGTIVIRNSALTNLGASTLQTAITFENSSVLNSYAGFSTNQTGWGPNLYGYNGEGNVWDMYVGGVRMTINSIDPLVSPALAKIKTGTDKHYNEKYTLSTGALQVVDSQGDPIEGAVVAWIDAQAGTGSDTTEANGEINSILTTRNVTGSSEVETLYTPFTFTISKAGYETVVIPAVAINTPIKRWIIVLKPKVRFDLEGTAYAMIGDKHVMELC